MMVTTSSRNGQAASSLLALAVLVCSSYLKVNTWKLEMMKIKILTVHSPTVKLKLAFLQVVFFGVHFGDT